MTAHAIGEGSGVGVAYSGRRGWAQGVLVTLAIGLHNIPEGLAVATVMIARGVPAKSAIWWTIMTAMPQAVVWFTICVIAVLSQIITISFALSAQNICCEFSDDFSPRQFVAIW